MMRMLSFVLGFVCVSWIACGQAGNDVESLVADETMRLPDKFSFDFLDEVVKGKRVVILGEALHTDGTTFEIKSKMVEYLAQKHGFNTLMVESLDFGKPNSGLAYFYMSKSCESLTKKIMRRTLPLDVVGLEAYYFSYVYVLDLLGKYGFEEEAHKLKDVFQKSLFKDGKGLFDDKTLTLRHPVDNEKLQMLLEAIGLTKNYLKMVDAPEKEVRYAERLLGNVREYMAKESLLPTNEVISDGNSMDYNKLREWTNLRDRQMGMGILTYLETHPERKVIVWCASFHGARDISQAIHPDYPLLYMQTKTMGEYLADALGDRLCSMAFTSYYAEPERCGELEKELCERGVDWGFVDFERLRFKDEFLNKMFNCNAIQRKDGRWMNVWDGLYFIREQKEDEYYDWEYARKLWKVLSKAEEDDL